MLEVSGDGVPSFFLPDTKLSKTFEYTGGASGIEVATQSLTSTGTNLSEAFSLSASKPYLITINAVFSCSNYVQALIGFTSTPYLVMGVNSARIINIPLNNPLPTIHVSGTNVITPTREGSLVIEVLRSGDNTITHYFTQLKVGVVEL